MSNDSNFQHGYSEVNGLKMYYEIHGQGKPLVLIHGGGSTMQTSFGKIISLLAKSRQVIAMELQAHGRTNDRDAALSFQQDADDVITLLNNLKITKADFLGFSNGAQTLIEIVLRHSEKVNKIILASLFYKRSAIASQFWEGFNKATLNDMPQSLKDGFLMVNNNTDLLLNMFNKDVQRMKDFKGWSDDEMKSINVPALVINGNNDVGSMEHAVEMSRVIPNCELVIFAGGHGNYIGTIESLENGVLPNFNAVALIEEFLNKNN